MWWRTRRSGRAALAGMAAAVSAALPAAWAAPAAGLRFASMGCWGGERHQRHRQRQMADRLRELWVSEGLNFTIAAGDNFYRKGVQSLSDPHWSMTYEDVYPRQMPFWVALGNHDYRGDIWAQVNYTTAERNRGGSWHLPYPYYTTTFPLAPGLPAEEGLELFVIDTVLMERCEGNPYGGDLWRRRCWDRGRQRDWLRAKLAASLARWRVVVGHYPMHANGPHINQLWLREWLEPLFAAHGVSLYINADNHYIQYSLHKGVYYLNAGGGGGYMLHTSREKHYRRDAGSLWEHFGDGVFVHYVSGDAMKVAAVAPDGAVLTRFTIPVSPTALASAAAAASARRGRPETPPPRARATIRIVGGSRPPAAAAAAARQVRRTLRPQRTPPPQPPDQETVEWIPTLLVAVVLIGAAALPLLRALRRRRAAHVRPPRGHP
eukprot:TRINITY_DN70877_c0_g1_i1.p1 TRINITY_DN70877_c0_g1~~TRINITY_DN70877_c0_g1_i1.p1  ORF type:complete len:434 (+),score=56.50 TRINITY_DN70877_c0_g1_i1:104-1405(+)